MSKNIKIAIVAVLAAVAAFLLYRRFASASPVEAYNGWTDTTPTKGLTNGLAVESTATSTKGNISRIGNRLRAAVSTAGIRRL